MDKREEALRLAGEAAKGEVERLRKGYGTEFMEIENELAPALGYPYDEDYGWVTGEHTQVTLAMEVRRRVEELQARLEKLEEQNARRRERNAYYAEKLGVANPEEYGNNWYAALDAFLARLERAEGALRFYAEEESWAKFPTGPTNVSLNPPKTWVSRAILDRGDKARAALPDSEAGKEE